MEQLWKYTITLKNYTEKKITIQYPHSSKRPMKNSFADGIYHSQITFILSQQPAPRSVLNNFEKLYTKDKNKKSLVLDA